MPQVGPSFPQSQGNAVADLSIHTCCSGLYVPTSDVDLVVLDTAADVQTGLKALANLLSRKGIAKGIQV